MHRTVHEMLIVPFGSAPYEKPIRYKQSWWKRDRYAWLESIERPKCYMSLDPKTPVAIFKADDWPNVESKIYGRVFVPELQTAKFRDNLTQ